MVLNVNAVQLVKVRYDRRTSAITQDWLNRRFAFFAQHTLRSLKLQTVKDWRLWINCECGMQEAVAPLRAMVPPETFWSFGDTPPTEIPLESDWQRLQSCSHVYVTRIDSDDLFACDALECVDRMEPADPTRVEALLFRRGYLYDTNTGRLGVYCNPSSPFHTLMFPRDDFLNPDRYARVWQRAGDHSRVGAAFHCQSLPDWKFCVLIHGSNFLSTFDYSREKEALVERGWTMERFLRQPVVFDVDDFCDKWNCLPELDRLKAHYPDFKATLFTIPNKTSKQLLREAKSREWIELGVHGINHDPDDEMVHVSYRDLRSHLDSLDYSIYAKVFRPPAWYLTSAVVDACNDAGLAIALHVRDRAKIGPVCRNGVYACGERLPHAHHHSHRVCQNYILDDLPRLLTLWPEDQRFSVVSDSILIPSR